MADGPFGRYAFGLTAEQEARAARLHADSLIIDMMYWGPVSQDMYPPALNDRLRQQYKRFEGPHRDLQFLFHVLVAPGDEEVAGRAPVYRQAWDASGVTAGSLNVQTASPEIMARYLTAATHLVDNLAWVRKALVAADFAAAKAAGQHAWFLHTQHVAPMIRDIDMVDLMHKAGLRVVQLTYNSMDHIGAGCTERGDVGLSNFGIQVVRRLNDLGVIVDTGHCGRQTTLDACRFSTAPVIASHTTVDALYHHDRGKSDEELQAIAATGGVVGVVTVPFFLASGSATMDTWLDHVDYLVRLIGWQHVAVGTDWPINAPEWAMQALFMDSVVPNAGFSPEHEVSLAALEGFADYRDFPNITRGLVARGYPDEQITGILGENFLRVFERVCG
ncbi:MAG: dipeptidase [Mycobacteriales bacterium]